MKSIDQYQIAMELTKELIRSGAVTTPAAAVSAYTEILKGVS